MSERYRTISVKTELADLIEKFTEANPQYGYRSIAQFMEDSARKRLEELKALGALPRFEQINYDENGAKILDRQIHHVITVFFKPNGIYCEQDQKDECEHIDFALAQPNIKAIIRKKRKEGWKLPEV